jgi:pyruvate kinase
MDSLAHKTKIVTTIGPASQTPEILGQMICAGMNIVPLNFSHGEFAGHRQVIENVRLASAQAGRPVAIMADLPGPKMRIGTFGSALPARGIGEPRIELGLNVTLALLSDSQNRTHLNISTGN